MYRTRDIAFMTDIKTAIYTLSRGSATAPPSWEYLRRYIVIEDLRKFINSSGQIQYTAEFIENVNYVDVDTLFVTLTNNINEVKVLDSLISAVNAKNYYRASYTKNSRSNIVYVDALTSALKSELKTIAPKRIIIFGKDIASQLGINEPLHQVFDYNTSKLIVTSSIVSMLVKPELTNTVKLHVWNDYKTLQQS